MQKNWVTYYAKKNWFWFLAVVALLIMIALINIRVADSLRVITDSVVVKDWNNARYNLLVLGRFILVGFLLYYLKQYVVGNWSKNNLVLLRSKFANVLLNITIEKLSTIKGGDILSIFTNDLRQVYVFYQVHLVNLVFQITMVVFSFAYLYRINKLATISIIVIVPVVIRITSHLTKSIEKNSRAIQKDIGEGNIVLQESLNGYSVLKSFCCERKFIRRYNSIIERTIDEGIQIDKKVLRMEYVITTIQLLPYFTFCLLGGYLLRTNSVSIGELVTFLNLFDYLYMSLTEIQYTINFIRVDIASIERLNEILNCQTEMKIDHIDYISREETDGAIEFRNVTFSYDDSSDALHDVSFKVHKGQNRVIFGVSGSGKSTIYQLLCKFHTNYKGSILLLGKEVREWNSDELRKKISIVSQDIFLFPKSVKENIAYGNQNATDQEIIEAAKMANAHDFIIGLPNGYETILYENGENLSGGQRQRILIARAIIKNAPILLLDEITSALDVTSSAKVESAIYNLFHKKTIMRITHKIDSIKDDTQVVFINDGCVIDNGQHKNLVKDNQLYKSLFEANCRGKESEVLHEQIQ